MKAYLDTSFIISLLTLDVHTLRARQFLLNAAPILWISDFSTTEFAAVIARRVRTGIITSAAAVETFRTFETWAANQAALIAISPGDCTAATSYIRRLDLALQAPDAVHIAIAHRIGATLVTFDIQMAASASALGLPIANA